MERIKKNEFGQSSLSKMEMMMMMTVVVVVLNMKSVCFTVWFIMLGRNF